MRVIAGVAKGRRLKSPPARVVRPTTDRVKEALFSALGPDVVDARVLDLYAGSGQLGIEALSRGAASATFVEADPGALSTIRENLAGTGLASQANVVAETVERFLAAAGGTRGVAPRPEGTRGASPRSQSQGPFDLVLIDPPFALGFPAQVLASLASGDLLSPEALVVVEVARAILPLEAPDGFRMAAPRRYGDSVLLFLRALPGAGSRSPSVARPAGNGDVL